MILFFLLKCDALATIAEAKFVSFMQTNRRLLKLILCCGAVLAVGSGVRAWAGGLDPVLRPVKVNSIAEPSPSPSPTPVATPVPESQEARKDLPFKFFPISIPYYFMKGATYPVAALGHLIESNKASRHIVGFMSSNKKSYSFYPKITVGDGGKFGGGFGFAHQDLFDKGYNFRLETIVFTDLDHRGSILIANPSAFRVWNRDFSFVALAESWKESDQDYFGIGPDTPESNKTSYAIQRVLGGVRFGFEIIPDLAFTPFVFFDFANTSSGKEGGIPSSQNFFPPSEVEGFGLNLGYANMGFRLSYDNRDQYLSPQRGGIYSLTYHRFQGLTHKGFDYHQFDLEAQHYFRLKVPRLVLALHNHWTFQAESGGGEIPFYRLAMLDVNSPLRGFDTGRFRDSGMVVFNVEQRFPLWDIVDGSVFIDTGRVFNGVTDFSFKDFKYSVGAGIRVTINRYYLFRLETAYGGEGMNVVFRVEQALDRFVH